MEVKIQEAGPNDGAVRNSLQAVDHIQGLL